MRIWDVTASEYLKITEVNQAGILSKSYVPGPLSLLENRLDWLKDWYLHCIADGG